MTKNTYSKYAQGGGTLFNGVLPVAFFWEAAR